MKDSSREKYAYVVALVAAMLAFTAFKESLASIKINFVFIDTDLLVLLIAFTVGLSLSAYLYACDYAIQGTALERFRFTKWVAKSANGVYIFTIASPIFLGVVWLTYKIIEVVIPLADSMNVDNSFFDLSIDPARIISGTIAATAAVLLIRLVINYVDFRERSDEKKAAQYYAALIDEFLRQSTDLYSQKFYGPAISEAFKVVEASLYSVLKRNNYLSPNSKFKDLMEMARKQKIITADEYAQLDGLRKWRNEAVHTSKVYSQAEAKQALSTAATISYRLQESLVEGGDDARNRSKGQSRQQRKAPRKN